MKKNPAKNLSELPSEVHQARAREIIYSIRRLMQAGELYTKELNKIYNVSAAQLNCLIALHENGPISPSQIAKFIMVNSSTVTGIIDRLEQKGLVEVARKWHFLYQCNHSQWLTNQSIDQALFSVSGFSTICHGSANDTDERQIYNPSLSLDPFYYSYNYYLAY